MLRSFLSSLELLAALQVQTCHRCSRSPDLVNLSLGLGIFSPPTNAEGLQMMEERFDSNSYLFEGRRAWTVNENRIILHFSSVSNKVYLSGTQLHQVIISQRAFWNPLC